MPCYRTTLIVSLLALSGTIGCTDGGKSDAGSLGQSIGKNVTEFAQGVGTGVDTQLQVEIEVSQALTDAGVTHTIAKQQSSLKEPEKSISIYLISEKKLATTLIAKAYNKDGQEVGRATADVKFEQDDAKYVPFVFPPEMDRQTVAVYKLDMRSELP